MSANWVQVAGEIVEELRGLTEGGARDQSVRLSLDELLARSGADSEPDGYRSRSYWAQCQRGDPYWTTLRNAGLVLNFDPDERGVEVENVTFRFNRLQP